MAEDGVPNRPADTPRLVPLGLQPTGDLEHRSWGVEDRHFREADCALGAVFPGVENNRTEGRREAKSGVHSSRATCDICLRLRQ